MPDETIGMIGLGLLGTALAERLLGAEYRVLGFDIEPSRLEHLRHLGGEAASGPAAVAENCRRVVFSLPNSQIVAAVVDQIDASLASRAILVDTTTGDPEASRRLGQRLSGRGASYLDVTVAGSSQQARAGDIVMMVGGGREAVADCQDLFSALARRSFHVGPCGAGAQMKLVVNLVLGLNRAVLAEGLSLAKACGIDPATALEVLRSGAAFSAAMDTKGPKMIQGDFAPQARLAQHRKDVELIMQLAERSRTPVPLSKAHAELLDRAIERGYGELDNSAVIKAFD